MYVHNMIKETQKSAAYVMTIMSAMIGSIALPSAQLLGGAVPWFELTAILFGIQAIASIPLLLYHKLSLWIPRKHVSYLLLDIIANIGETVCFFSATQYLPVGSEDALGAALVILMCTAVSLLQQTTSKALLMSVVVCIIGILLVAQPAVIFEHANLYETQPTNWTSECAPYGINKMNNTQVLSINNTEVNVFPIRDIWIGYILIGMYAISFCANMHLLQYLVEHLPYQVVLFYTVTCCALLAVTAMAFLEVPSFPTHYFCI